jgi:asparagine synthase (glutamine-hydrolysing)
MCGIAGIVGSHADRDRAAKMDSAIAIAGLTMSAPGARRASRSRTAGSRSSICPGRHQPMASRDGRYHIVYNGEIYNDREIAAKLPDVAWRSESDTEVLLEAYAAWGRA